MSEPENKQPAEVLRTKRLEIVDDEGKVRAVLATDEKGVTSLSMFDQSARLRASLDTSDAPEQMNGLGLFDTNRRLQIAMGAHTTPEKGGSSTVTAQTWGGRLIRAWVGGEPRLYVADEEGRPIVGQGAFHRVVAERGLLYQ